MNHVSDIPAELEILLLPLPERLHAAMTRAFYDQFAGDPSSPGAQSALLLSGLVYAAKSNGSSGTNHTEDLETVRSEITGLAQIIRGVGESTAKVERRFQIVGDTLSKFEQRVDNIEKQLATMDQATSVFRKISAANVRELIGVSFAAGAILTFAVHLFFGWF